MCFPAGLLSGTWGVTNSRKATDTQGTRATKPTRVGAKVVVATRMVQQNPLDSLFGSMGTNAMTGLGGLGGASLQSANSGNDLLQLAALLRGSQQQIVTFQPVQLLQVRQALAQQQATQLAAQQAEIQKRIEAEATTRAAQLVNIEHEKQKQRERNRTQTR